MTDQESAALKLERVEALLERWLSEDRQMRRSYGVPLLNGAVATCAEELAEALSSK
ncbi:MAG TPA: hypothetical protein VN108_03125 [Marmoricola sp.]|nr:hypothetical protein [Marmoricola sp.]